MQWKKELNECLANNMLEYSHYVKSLLNLLICLEYYVKIHKTPCAAHICNTHLWTEFELSKQKWSQVCLGREICFSFFSLTLLHLFTSKFTHTLILGTDKIMHVCLNKKLKGQSLWTSAHKEDFKESSLLYFYAAFLKLPWEYCWTKEIKTKPWGNFMQ